MSNFSPIYGESPSSTRLPVNVDAAGNLIVSASSPPPTSATATLSSVNGAASSTQLLAANTGRKGAYFYNDSTAILYLAFAGSASTTAYTLQIASQWFD